MDLTVLLRVLRGLLHLKRPVQSRHPVFVFIAPECRCQEARICLFCLRRHPQCLEWSQHMVGAP